MNNAIFNQKTKRLILRRLGEKDCSFILELVNTEGWLKFIGDRNVHNEKDSLNYIENINNKDNVTYLVATLKDNTQIGIITIIKRDYFEFYDIGFAFLPLYNNKGYAYEASKVILNYIEQSTNFRAILASTVPLNKSSIKLIEKLDLTFYKTVVNENEELKLYKMDIDKIKIDKVIKSFFNAFTNKGKRPNLELLHETCIAEIVIIKNTDSVCEKYNLVNFIAPRKELLTNGTLTEFEEYETEEQTTIVRNIAQRLSNYMKEGILNSQSFSNKGTKIFQLVKIESVWKISCVIWDDE